MRKKIIERECTVVIGSILIENIRFVKKIGELYVYFVGGPYFGPYVGSDFWGKRYIFATQKLQPDATYHCQLISKTTPSYYTEYLFLTPTTHPADHVLDLQFTEVWEYTKKLSLWYMSTKENPLPEKAEVLFRGIGTSQNGLRGSEWALYLVPFPHH